MKIVKYCFEQINKLLGKNNNTIKTNLFYQKNSNKIKKSWNNFRLEIMEQMAIHQEAAYVELILLCLYYKNRLTVKLS